MKYDYRLCGWPVLIVSSLVHVYSIGYMSHDPRGRVMGKRVYGDKLSNSGDILKLKIPSCSRKAISGWSNYSGTVTSLKMSENEMDYRGSKSTISLVSTIFLVSVSLLVFALSPFIPFILSLPWTSRRGRKSKCTGGSFGSGNWSENNISFNEWSWQSLRCTFR